MPPLPTLVNPVQLCLDAPHCFSPSNPYLLPRLGCCHSRCEVIKLHLESQQGLLIGNQLNWHPIQHLHIPPLLLQDPLCHPFGISSLGGCFDLCHSCCT